MAHEDRNDEEIAEAQGWTDSTLLGLTREWIDGHADKRSYVDFLARRAEEENAAADAAAAEELSARVGKIKAPQWQDEDGWDEP